MRLLSTILAVCLLVSCAATSPCLHSSHFGQWITAEADDSPEAPSVPTPQGISRLTPRYGRIFVTVHNRDPFPVEKLVCCGDDCARMTVGGRQELRQTFHPRVHYVFGGTVTCRLF